MELAGLVAILPELLAKLVAKLLIQRHWIGWIERSNIERLISSVDHNRHPSIPAYEACVSCRSCVSALKVMTMRIESGQRRDRNFFG